MTANMLVELALSFLVGGASGIVVFACMRHGAMITLLAALYSLGALYHFSLLVNQVRIYGAPARSRWIPWILMVVFWPATQAYLLVVANWEQWMR